MYLHHELREVCDYRQTEALERINLLHSLMQRSPGFVRSLACRYLGSTSHYAWLRLWLTSADHAAFRKTDAAAGFAATRPDGLYWQLPGGIAPGGHWQSVLQSGVDGLGSYLIRFAFSVPIENVEEFLASRKRHDELALLSPGILSIATFQSEEESPARIYLSLMRTQGAQAYRDFLEGELGEAYRSGLRQGCFETLASECYEIITELVGK